MALYSTAIMTLRSVKKEKRIVPGKTARAIDAGLDEWFEHHQRDLNFRKTLDAYAVMVSEFMLQQTTVATVEAYFARFMKQFPSVKALAGAKEDDVLGAWAGLGYYRRARQLHGAACAIVEEYNGEIPRDAAMLEKLPGIGKYTAGAISSTAYDEPAPILEANTVRVFSRISGTAGMVGDTKFMTQLWQVARELVEAAESPRRFNVAAMELGSLVCRPKPLCDQCPVQDYCTAYRLGAQESIPTMRPRRESVDLQVVGFVLSNPAGEFLVRQIPKGEWHAGMWEFPTVRLEGKDVPTTKQVQAAVKAVVNAFPADLDLFHKLRYQVTHHKISLSMFRGTADHLQVKEPYAFLSLDRISGLPMGSAQTKVLKVLQETETS